MNTLHQRPQPLYGSPSRPICPVCGHTSYSSAGIHPQCSMHASDQVQANRVKRQNLAKAESGEKSPGKFEKQCPKCQKIHHIRKHDCDCGHSFRFKNLRVASNESPQHEVGKLPKRARGGL